MGSREEVQKRQESWKVMHAKAMKGLEKGVCVFFFFNAQLKMVKSSHRRIEGDYLVFKHDKALF